MAGDKDKHDKTSGKDSKNANGKDKKHVGKPTPVGDNMESDKFDKRTDGNDSVGVGIVNVNEQDRVNDHVMIDRATLEQIIEDRIKTMNTEQFKDKGPSTSSASYVIPKYSQYDSYPRKRKIHEISERSSEELQDSDSGEHYSDSDTGSEGWDTYFKKNVKVDKPAENKDKQCSFDKALASLEKFFENEEAVGPAVRSDLASIIDGSLRRKPNEKKVLEMAENQARPQNLPNLTVPKTNAVVWERMRKGPRVVDAAVQKVQAILAKSMIPIFRVMEHVGKGEGGDNLLEPLTDAVRLSCASFNFLNQVRKDVVRNELNDPTLARLCTWETPVGVDTLFGVDVLKKLKELDETKSLDRRLKKKGRFGSYGYQGGWNRGNGTKTFGYQSSHYNNYRGKKPFLGQNRRGKKRPSPREKN